MNRKLQSFATLGFALLCSLEVLAQSVPSLINYQGRLTDQTGAPLAASTYTIQFRLWNDPTAKASTNLIWSQQQSVAVQTNGVFDVLLGSSNGSAISGDSSQFTDLSSAFGSSNVFLGLTVVSNNGVSIANATEILPRQQFLTTPFAFASAFAATAQTVLTSPVPRGVIVMWYGAIASIPTGWALCDGNNGTPDLRDRFVVGARADSSGVANTSITGSPTQTGGATTHTHTGTTDQAQVIWPRGAVSGDPVDDNSGGTDFTIPVSHSHTFTTGASSNLPPYYALAFIMKL